MNGRRYRNNINRRNTDVRRDNSRRVRIGKLILFTVCVVCVLSIAAGALRSKAGNEKDPKFKYYTSVTVKEGDTLWSIADQYMDKDRQSKISYINEVKSINHIHDADEIITGKLLIVPYYSSEFIAD